MKDNGGLLFDTCKDCLKFISEIFGCPYPYKIKPGETKCQE